MCKRNIKTWGECLLGDRGVGGVQFSFAKSIAFRKTTKILFLLLALATFAFSFSYVNGTDGIRQAELRLPTQHGKWIESGIISKGFEPDDDIYFVIPEVDATDLRAENIFVVNVNEVGDWTVEPSSMKYDKRRCRESFATVKDPDEVEIQVETVGPLIFYLCAGDGVELKSKSGSRKSNTTFATFVLKRNEGSAWSKLKLRSAKPAFRVFLEDSYKTKQAKKSLFAAYHPVLGSTKNTTGRLQLASFRGTIVWREPAKLHVEKWQYKHSNVFPPNLTSPVGRIESMQHFILNYDPTEDWSITATANESEGCVEGTAPLGHPTGTVPNYIFYLCPGEGVVIHKRSAKDDFGNHAMFISTNGMFDGVEYPAIKVYLRNYLTVTKNKKVYTEYIPVRQHAPIRREFYMSTAV